MSGLLSKDLNNEQMGRFKELFKSGFNYLYSGDVFDTLVEHAKVNPKEAVATFTATLASKIIEKTGENDILVLMSSMLAVMSKSIDDLRELGIEISDDDVMEIISKAIQQTLSNSPEFAKTVESDPETAKMMQGADNGIV